MVYALNALVFTMGIFFIVGAYRRWGWLVDPQVKLRWWLVDSSVLLKRLFGAKFVVIFTYLLGVVLCGLAVWGSILHFMSRN